ncbi:hypothetical protein SDC9_172636 [bioreactor metagenome]|uniref:Uncharacterized protein n=1 Tax=bioreactor metagenome TaxID=1076179 RepID=A0A645GHK0_9ZZZZ
MTDDNQRFDCGWTPFSEFSAKYYHLRWRKFFEFLANSFGRLGVPDRARNQFYERDAYTYSQFNRDMSKFEKGVMLSFSPSIDVSGNTKEIAAKLIEKYIELIFNN